MNRTSVHEGELHGGIPVLRFGQGPPLVVISGLTATHSNPSGWKARFELRPYRELASFFTVYLVNRKPNLDPGTTMADLADQVAEALQFTFAEPVPALGISTGGSIGLRAAIDHPDVLSRLVVASAACRLSERGRAMQQQLMLAVAADRPRAAGYLVGEVVADGPVTERLIGGALWATNFVMDPADPSDVLVTLVAEDGFDVCAELGNITVPTLVVGGEHDRLYGAELFEETAHKVPHGRLFLVEGGGHGSPLMSADAREHILDFFLEEELAHLGEHPA
jgi:pimeloyl-ACP methyl ester carboxylesterase